MIRWLLLLALALGLAVVVLLLAGYAQAQDGGVDVPVSQGWPATVVSITSHPAWQCPLVEKQGAQVTPALVCAVHDAIKLARSPRWSTDTCKQVAATLNETRDPRQMAAICTDESDFRPDVVREVNPGVYDVGLCGVRCVLGDEPAREGKRSSAGPNPKHTTLAPSGRCANGPARGYMLSELLDPVVNIRVAASVLAGHGGSLRRYSGGTREHGYEARIKAIEAALSGVVVETDTPRMEKLVAQIARAVGKP